MNIRPSYPHYFPPFMFFCTAGQQVVINRETDLSTIMTDFQVFALPLLPNVIPLHAKTYLLTETKNG